MVGELTATKVAIRPIDTTAELVAINALFQQVWGAPEPIVHVDLLRAVGSAGGGLTSDRLVMAWPTGERTVPARPGPGAVPEAVPEAVGVATPDDIVVLRRTDRAAADEWHPRWRGKLGGRLTAGARVTGFTRASANLLDDVLEGSP